MRERLKFTARRTFGPITFVEVAFTAGLEQLEGYPSEWQQGVEGYAQRFGYQYAQNIAGGAIQFGLGAALHEDPRYYPSNSKDFWDRTGHAIVHTFLIYKTDGRRTFAISRIASSYGTAFLAAQYPGRGRTVEATFAIGTISAAAEIGNSLLQEFSNDIRTRILPRLRDRVFGRKRRPGSR